MCYELNCSSEICEQGGAQLFKFHLDTLYFNFSHSTSLPVDMSASPLQSPELLYQCRVYFRSATSHATLSCKLLLQWQLKDFFVLHSAKKREKELSKSTSLTHRVSDEILQGASLNKLCYQIEPLILVQHTDELQNVGVIKTSHYFDLNIRHKQTSS